MWGPHTILTAPQSPFFRHILFLTRPHSSRALIYIRFICKINSNVKPTNLRSNPSPCSIASNSERKRRPRHRTNRTTSMISTWRLSENAHHTLTKWRHPTNYMTSSSRRSVRSASLRLKIRWRQISADSWRSRFYDSRRAKMKAAGWKLSTKKL